jgi:hypothetical protein
VVIKEEYVTLTGDHVSAILLSQIEYWTMRTHDFDRFLAEEKGRSSNEGNEINFSFMHGWIYKTAEDLSAETMMGLSANTIRTRLKKLVERGWIGERNNPAYRWDHTKQYRFNAAKVAMDLNTHGYPLEGWAITDSQGGDVGYIRDPDLVRPGGLVSPAEEIGRDRVVMIGVGGGSPVPLAQRSQSLFLHQPGHPVVAAGGVAFLQCRRDAPHSVQPAGFHELQLDLLEQLLVFNAAPAPWRSVEENPG